MAIKTKDLIKKLQEKDQDAEVEFIVVLQEKDQDAEVEFIVVTTDGVMVCMDIKTQAPNSLKLLKLFNSGK